MYRPIYYSAYLCLKPKYVRVETNIVDKEVHMTLQQLIKKPLGKQMKGQTLKQYIDLNRFNQRSNTA